MMRENIYVLWPANDLRQRLLALGLFRRRGRRGRLVRFFRQGKWGVALPRGLWPKVRDVVGNSPVKDLRFAGPPLDFRWRGELRPEQAQAAWRLHAEGGGILLAWPGAGKTNLGLGMVAAWRQPCLWVVHTAALAAQALQRAHELFALGGGAFGLVGDGKCSWGTHLTVALVQTLAQGGYPEEARIGTVVVDECHHAPAMNVAKVLSRLPARYRLGLTATPERSDGLGELMVALLGPAVVEIAPKKLVERGRVVLPEVKVVLTKFSCAQVPWPRLQRARARNRERNALVVRLARDEAGAGHRMLILTELVSHARLLAGAIERLGVAAVALVGGTMPADRERALAAAADGRVVLVATKLADEGLDLPALDRLVLACPGKSAGRLTQQIGRIARAWEGKEDALVYDVADPLVAVLASQLRLRLAAYRAMGLRVRRARG